MRSPTSIAIAETAASAGSGKMYVPSVACAVRFVKRCTTTTSTSGPWTLTVIRLSSMGSALPCGV